MKTGDYLVSIYLSILYTVIMVAAYLLVCKMAADDVSRVQAACEARIDRIYIEVRRDTKKLIDDHRQKIIDERAISAQVLRDKELLYEQRISDIFKTHDSELIDLIEEHEVALDNMYKDLMEDKRAAEEEAYKQGQQDGHDEGLLLGGLQGANSALADIRLYVEEEIAANEKELSIWKGNSQTAKRVFGATSG